MAQVPPFPQPGKPPGDDEVAALMGAGFKRVVAAVDRLRDDHRAIRHAYTFSKTSGWYLTYDKGRQRLFYLFPKRGDFLLKIVFNDRGLAILRKADIGAVVKEKLGSARKFPEGTLLEFTAAEITAAVLTELLRIKISSVVQGSTSAEQQG